MQDVICNSPSSGLHHDLLLMGKERLPLREVSAIRIHLGAPLLFVGITRSLDKSHLESDAKNIHKNDCWWWKLSAIHASEYCCFLFRSGGSKLKFEWTLELKTKDVLMKR